MEREESLGEYLLDMPQIAGMGHDVVDCASFREQLELPGSRFDELFSAREKAQCRARSGQSHDDYASHLAARWAGKEAFLKAWSHALAPSVQMPYTIENFPWSSIEILNDSVHRPAIFLAQCVEEKLRETLGTSVHSHISMSHDGGIASAVVILETRRA